MIYVRLAAGSLLVCAVFLIADEVARRIRRPRARRDG